MTDRKNAVIRFRLWLRTFIESLTIDQRSERIHYVRPSLEAVEDRALPSASAGNALPFYSLASPPPVPSLTAVTSFMTSLMNEWGQLIETAQQDVMGVWKAIEQGIAQEASFIQQQWDQLLGTDSVASIPGPGTAVIPLAYNSGQGQSLTNGSGSGSDTMTTSHDGNTQPVGTFKPLDVSASGSGTDSGSSSFNATVTGQIWLDNDHDGSIDENEMDYAGAQVTLLYQVGSGGGATWSTLASTTTNGNLTGNNYSISAVIPPGGSYSCKIDVAIPLDFGDESGGYGNDVDALGFSPVFTLSAGNEEIVGAALDSMNVNTLTDDPDGVLQQDKVTLRDAIKTGNNGPPFPAVTFDKTPPGTINLQKALDAIKVSYDINGPGADTLTVKGGGVANPFRIFTINAGVTSTIRGLTIKSGYAQNDNGGGILNNGNLTLNSDTVTGNQAAGNLNGGLGGGIYNAAGADLQLQTVLLSLNEALLGGGLYNNGIVTICCGSVIDSNTASSGGGGIFNQGGTINTFDNTKIQNNKDTGFFGGGVDNKSGTFTMNSRLIYSNQELNGGGGGVLNSGTMTLSSVALQDNDANSQGGGIYVGAGKLTLWNSYVGTNSKNVASDGGGMFIKGGTVKMSYGAVDSNSAIKTAGNFPNTRGGGIYVSSGSLTLSNVRIKHNLSAANGGGMYVNGGTVKVSGGTIIDNRCLQNGGGLYVNGGTLKLMGNVNITKNSILPGFTSNGAGLYVYGGTVSMVGGWIDNNTGANQGGGIYNWRGTLTLSSTVNIDTNDASNQGGGMYLAAFSTTTFIGTLNPYNPSSTARVP